PAGGGAASVAREIDPAFVFLDPFKQMDNGGNGLMVHRIEQLDQIINISLGIFQYIHFNSPRRIKMPGRHTCRKTMSQICTLSADKIHGMPCAGLWSCPPRKNYNHP